MKDLVIGGRKFKSRFFLGTGKFASGEMLKRALAACGTELVTTALTRVHEGDAEHDDILGVIDRSKVEVMLNTSGARNAAEAVRIAKLGKAAGYNWIKIEVHPDARYLLPDPVETLEAVKGARSSGWSFSPTSTPTQCSPATARTPEPRRSCRSAAPSARTAASARAT